MKLLLTFGVVFWCALGYAQIPNGDFEQWEVRDHFKLSNYNSPTRNVERTTDAKEGIYALKLSNTHIENATGYRGYAHTVDKPNGLNGFAFSGDALSLVFWSKHELAEGDTARVYAVFRDKGAYKGKVDFRFTGSSNGDWRRYSVPIEWNGSRLTDSVWLYFYSYADATVDGDGWVIFDDIHFEKIGQRMPDVTNFGFEEWYNTGISYPKYWRSLDLLVYDTYTSFLHEQSTFQVTQEDAFSGNYSLLIKNYDNYGSPRYSYAYVGDKNDDTYTPAFALNDTFRYLQGYYKYIPDVEDTARLLFRTWEGSTTRSYDNLLFFSTAEDWTFFFIPINYYTQDARPDSGALVLYSGIASPAHGFNSSFYLDDLELVMQPKSVSVKELSITSHFSVYPNPTSTFVNINANLEAHLIIYNSYGAKLVERKIVKGHNMLDLSYLPNSIYTFHFKTNNNQWIQKIVKQ